MINTYKHKLHNSLIFAKTESHLTYDHFLLPDFNINDYAEAESIKADVDEFGYSPWRLDQLNLKGSPRVRAQWIRAESEIDFSVQEVWS